MYDKSIKNIFLQMEDTYEDALLFNFISIHLKKKNYLKPQPELHYISKVNIPNSVIQFSSGFTH